MEDMHLISKNASKKISIFMIICCILVVMYHSTGYKYYELSQSLTNDFAKIMVDLKNPLCQLVALPGFCFFSGFLFYKNIEKPGFPTESIKTRFISLLCPYILWNFIWTLFMACISLFPSITSMMSTMKSFSWTIKDFLGGVLLHQYCGVTWYLLYMFIYALLSPAFLFLLNNRTISRFVILLLILLSPMETVIFENNVLIWPLFMYLWGAYCSIYHFEMVNTNIKNNVNYMLIIPIMFLLIGGSKWNLTGYFWSLIYNCLRGIGFWGAWKVLDLVYEKIRLRKWMNYYFFIYVFHNIPLLCIDKVLRLVLPSNWGGLVVNHFLGIIMVIIISVGIAYVTERYMPPIWMALTGKRVKTNCDY